MTSAVSAGSKISPSIFRCSNKGKIVDESTLIMLIGFVGCILCLIPLFSGFQFNYENFERDNAPVSKSIGSDVYKTSLIATVALSIPMLLDYGLELYSYGPSYKGYFARGLLLFSLFVSNLILLLIAVPEQSPFIITIVLRARGVVWTSAAFAQLWEFGCEAFQYKSLLITTIILYSLCNMCLSFASFAPVSLKWPFFFIYVVLGFIGFCIFTFLTLKWCRIFWKLNYKDITASQYKCNVYLISLWLLLLGFTVLDSAYSDSKYGGIITVETSPRYLSGYCYLIAIFTTSVSVLHGGVARKEVFQTQVRTSFAFNVRDICFDFLASIVFSNDNSLYLFYILKQVLETKRVFVRYVSHEIRTPLNTVCMGLKLLAKDIQDNKRSLQENLKTIRDVEHSCQISLNILNDLLDYEKLEAGILKLDKAKVPAWPFLFGAISPFYLQVCE